jgi:beta-galactosidase
MERQKLNFELLKGRGCCYGKGIRGALTLMMIGLATLSAQPLQVGVSYYPEQVSPGEWPADFRKMKDAGIKRIRIGEFAWSSMEPEPGLFRWEWLDEAIDLAGEYGIQVVLCTPTAAPPVWLSDKHPETLPVNEVGYRNPYGCRQHRCYNTPAYQEYSGTITTELARRYGRHPNVVAWQLDNEFGGEQKFCYCEYCEKEFQEFLRSRYGTIEELNRRWINTFWSGEYLRFDQVRTPRRYEATLWLKNHPSLELEFCRFSSRSIVDFANSQASIIRQYAPEQPITTNRSTFAWGDNLEWYPLVENLDFAGFDLYSDKPYELAFYADFNRSLNGGRSWLMEFSVHSKDLHRDLEMMEARGVDWLFFFKFRPFPAGQEQGMRSLVTITGEPAKNYHTLVKWTREQPKVTPLAEPDIGLVYDFESSWVYYIRTWGDYTDRLLYSDYLLHRVYKSLYRPATAIRIQSPRASLEGLKVILLPRQILYSPELESNLEEFIQRGGTAIITNDFFWKNRDNVYLTELPGFYTRVLSVEDNNFIHAEEGAPLVLREQLYGKGKVVMVNRNADAEGWGRIMEEYVY